MKKLSIFTQIIFECLRKLAFLPFADLPTILHQKRVKQLNKGQNKLGQILWETEPSGQFLKTFGPQTIKPFNWSLQLFFQLKNGWGKGAKVWRNL